MRISVQGRTFCAAIFISLFSIVFTSATKPSLISSIAQEAEEEQSAQTKAHGQEASPPCQHSKDSCRHKTETPADKLLGEHFASELRIYDARYNSAGKQRLLSQRNSWLKQLSDDSTLRPHVVWNEDFLSPRAVFYPAWELGNKARGADISDARLVELAFAQLNEQREFLKVDPLQLRLRQVKHVRSLRIVQFLQTFDSTIVRPAFVNVCFFQAEDKVVLSRIDCEAFLASHWANYNNVADLQPAEAVLIAKSTISKEHDVKAKLIATEIAADWNGSGKNRVPRLAYRVELVDSQKKFIMHILVDSLNGKVIAAHDTYKYIDFTGNISGFYSPGEFPDTASNPEALLPISGLRVIAPGVGSAVTNINGDFTIPHSGTNNNILQIELTGPFVTVQDTANNDISLQFSQDPANPANITLNQSPSENTTAQLNGFVQTNRVHDYIKAIDPGFTQVDVSLACIVNINDNCNAVFTGSAINFFVAGQGCVNTSYASVVHHEYGHFVIDRSFPAFFPIGGSFHEGIADVCSALLADSPDIGAGFNGGFGFLRNVHIEDRVYPQDAANQIHDAGLIIGGAFWDTLLELRPVVGNAAALDLCRDYFLFHMNFQTGVIGPMLTADVLMVDDNDGNLLNGTPHYAEIAAGFSAHGLPAPALQIISFAHTPHVNTIFDQTPFTITATVTSVNGPISSLEIAYGTPPNFNFVSMSPTGQPDEFSGQIPAHASPARVQYYLHAVDDTGFEQDLPADGPLNPFGFYVGDVQFALSENVGNTDNGWTHVELANQDDWQRGVPNPSQINSWDPIVAFSQPNVWGNDLAGAGFNGDYQNNVSNYLESPSVDCSNHSNVYLQYRRWLTVESAQYDQATVRVNGNLVYVNPLTVDQVDSSWVTVNHDISSIAANQPDVRIRFSLITDPGLVYGGWNIDNIRVITVEPSNPTIFSMHFEDQDVDRDLPFSAFVKGQNDEEVTAYSIAAQYDTTVLNLNHVDLLGTTSESLQPDIFIPHINPATGVFGAEIIFDTSLVQTLASGTDQDLLNCSFEVSPSATVGSTSNLEFLPIGTTTFGDNQFHLTSGLVEFAMTTSGTITVASATGVQFIRGDVDGNTSLQLPDVVSMLGYLFNSGIVECEDRMDFDDSGSVNLPDAIQMLNYLFIGGQEPAAPFPMEGADPTADSLSCPSP